MTPDTQTEQDVFCPTCEAGRMRLRHITEHFPYEVDGETKMVVAENVPVHVCDECGEKLSGPEAARIRHEAICRALGLLTPAEIRSIRERLGLTQEQFTKLTRVGEATICRWERGRLLQNPAMDRYLRLITSSENNVRFLQQLQGSEPNHGGTPDPPPVPPEVPPMSAKSDDVEKVALWLRQAAVEAGQVELVRSLIRAAVNVVGEIYDPLEGENELDPDDPRHTIGGRFAAAWDECDRDQRADG